MPPSLATLKDILSKHVYVLLVIAAFAMAARRLDMHVSAKILILIFGAVAGSATVLAAAVVVCWAVGYEAWYPGA